MKILAGLLIVSFMLSACGSSMSKESGYSPAREYYDDDYALAEAAGAEAYDYSTDDVYAYDMEAEEAVEPESANAEILEEGSPQSDRKLIKNVNMNVETEEFDKFLINIDHKVASLGGYVERSEISGKSLYADSSNRTASITARVPNDKLDSFVNQITEQSNITNKTVSTEDVTLQYADTQAHIESLKTEQKRLNDLIEKAEDLDTILTLEARLTEVSYQIESYERQIRSMDNQVDYSTVYLYVEEVTHYTPVEKAPLSAGERISQGLKENLYRIGHGFSEFGINFVIALPFIILMLLIVGVIALVIVLIVKSASKKAAKNAEKRRQIYMQQQQMQQNAAKQQQVNKPAVTEKSGEEKPEQK